MWGRQGQVWGWMTGNFLVRERNVYRRAPRSARKLGKRNGKHSFSSVDILTLDHWSWMQLDSLCAWRGIEMRILPTYQRALFVGKRNNDVGGFGINAN